MSCVVVNHGILARAKRKKYPGKSNSIEDVRIHGVFLTEVAWVMGSEYRVVSYVTRTGE